MKRIYIGEAIHDQLKREAKMHGRTLQWWVENKLTQEDTIVTYTTKHPQVETVITPKSAIHKGTDFIEEPTVVPEEDA